jgi:hypothetical protein
MKPIKEVKAPKALKNAHTSNSKKGMGDYYGTGITAKIGRMREGVGFESVSPKKLKTPPKSLA